MSRKPGTPVRGSTTGRPIMALLDVMGQRWTLRILWELAQKRATFRNLQDNCGGVSPTVLNARLKELRQLRLVELNDDGYGLTKQGEALAQQLAPLDQWANEWSRSLDD